MDDRLRAALATLPPEVSERFRLDRLPYGRPTTSTQELLRLDGSRALVTGGGGTGLGAAICHRLAEQGARVAVLDMSLSAAQATADSLREQWGGEAIGLQADVTDASSVADAVSAVTAQWGGVDLLVNNAGGGLGSGEFVTSELSFIEAVVRLNLLGVLTVTHTVLPQMLAAGSGCIINIASEGGKFAAPLNVVYNSCKAAVIAFTRNLAHEVGPRGVRTVSVCPGLMVAEGNATFMADPTDARRRIMDDAMPRATLGRCSLPDEVASMVAFLASRAGDYVHGTAVSVGGGLAD